MTVRYGIDLLSKVDRLARHFEYAAEPYDRENHTPESAELIKQVRIARQRVLLELERHETKTG